MIHMFGSVCVARASATCRNLHTLRVYRVKIFKIKHYLKKLVDWHWAVVFVSTHSTTAPKGLFSLVPNEIYKEF